MKKSIASIFLLLSTFFFSAATFAVVGVVIGAGGASPTTALPDPVIVEKWKKFDGQKIGKLTFVGLKRTREIACRWLMQSLEGETFSSYQFAIDLQTLSNTDDLYDVQSEVANDPALPTTLVLTVTVNDKWSIFPVIEAKGGGGSLAYRIGAYDANLLGTFTQAEATLYNYDGIPSYDINFFNEFIAGSQIMGMIDWANSVNPTNVYNSSGTVAGNYTWQRQQEEFLVGFHLPGPTRILIFGDYFFDSMLNSVSVNASVFSGIQYRLHPQIIFGRVNIVDYLEDGQEITIQPMSANPFGPVQAYQGLDIQYKNVIRVGARDNIAVDFFGGAMSLAPSPYEYEVGGYYNLRGYADSRQMGPYTAIGHLEYRPYIYKYDFKTPLGLIEVDDVVLQGCLFTDFGSAWGDPVLTGDPALKQLNVLWSAGAGVRVNLLHFSSALLRWDFARTIRPDEGWGMSFGVGQLF